MHTSYTWQFTNVIIPTISFTPYVHTGPMVHQLMQEGVLWSSVMVTLGLRMLNWCKVKLNWALLDGSWKMHNNINVIHCD